MATRRIAFAGALAGALLIPGFAEATLTASPLTWNVIGLDSNAPAAGPNHFPVGARVCSDVATANVDVKLVWDSANANVNLRPGSLATITIPSIAAGACVDAYFEVEVAKVAAAYDTTRRYHITATDASGTASTPTPRELYVEHLISQNRNAITGIKLDGASVPAGGALTLVVGNTYTIELDGGTATQGYNQFEAFINFPNTIFQILAVSTTYSADNSPWVPGPFPAASDKLYADACLWDNGLASPNYRSCVGGDYKAGGSDVRTTYTIRIIAGGGTSQTLSSLLYDFSGSSYHYNSDFSVNTWIADIVDPTSVTIAKAFSPTPTVAGGTSTLTFTLTNPNPGAVSGASFTDPLPLLSGSQMVVATPAVYSTAGCGAPTFAPVAGASAVTFANGTIAAGGSCVVSVRVSVPPVPTTGTYTNVSGNLFIGAADTGHSGTATLGLTTSTPGTNLCGLALAQWTMAPAAGTGVPPAYSFKAGDVAAASAAAGAGLTSSINTTIGNPVNAWAASGFATGTALDTTQNDYFEFAATTTNYTGIGFKFDARLDANAHGPGSLRLYSSTDGVTFTPYGAVISPTNAFVTYNPSFSGTANASGLTYFRIYGYNAGNNGADALLILDNVAITGCQAPQPPTLAKAFSTNPVAVGGVSTLTFTLTNPNSAALSGAKFSDTLPAGLQVASPPNSTTTCTGSPSWSPAAGATTLDFGQTTGAGVPASGSCTASVDVTATTAGPHTNVSGFISSTESGTNSGSGGSAVASLTAVLPPAIDKAFGTNPIVGGATSLLTFTISNPNPSDALAGVAFADAYPAGVTNANPLLPAPTNTCGGTLTAAAGGNGASLVGGALAAGGSCTITVPVTAATAGSYVNTSGAVSASVAGSGNTASDTLVVVAPNPAIGLHKQVGPAAAGPWYNFVAVAPGTPIYYRFTAENTGDVTLATFGATDPALAGSPADPANCTWVSANSPSTLPTLPLATATIDPTATCVVGPISAVLGDHVNTASASGVYSGTSYPSGPANAEYLGAVPGFTLVKDIGTAAGGPWSSAITVAAGTGLYYRFTLANTGGLDLSGVNVTDPLVSTASCTFTDPLLAGAATFCVVGPVSASGAAGSTTTNTAVGHGANGGTTYDTAPASASYTIPAPSADVSLVKTLTTAGPFTVGQSISYTLVVANAGPDPATNVQITDTPTDLAIASVAGAGCAALPCTLASLAVGASATITVTATINAAGGFDNSATALAAESDPDLANNTDSSGNGGVAAASADVSLVKTLTTAGPFFAGQAIVYSIVVANAGPSAATNVQVTDTPTNLTIGNVSGGGCSALPCTIASLAPGASVTITASATIDANGAFDNAATAIAAEPDPDLTNNTDSAGNGGTAGAGADLAIAKSDGLGTVLAGGTTSYTLTAVNNGPSAVTSAVLADPPAAGLAKTLVACSPTPGQCATPPTIAELESGAFALPLLPNGATYQLVITAIVTAVGGNVTNTATIAAPAGVTDPDNTNNAATDVDAVVGGPTGTPTADLALTKTDGVASVNAGGSTAYTIVVTNNGPDEVANATLADPAAPGLVLGAWTCAVTSPGAGGSVTTACGSAGGSGPVSATVTMKPGAAITFVVNASVTAAAGTTVVNTASIAPPSGVIDPAPGNNSATDTDSVVAAPASADLAITKTDGVASVNAGGSTTYTITVTNNGPDEVTGAAVVDDAPAGLAFGVWTCAVTNPGAGGSVVTACGAASGAGAVNTTVTMKNGAAVTFTVPATVAPGASGTLVNTATVAVPAGVTDSAPGNNSATDSDAVVVAPASADLAITKTSAAASVPPGGSTSYTLTVTNNGPAEVTGASVVDNAPAGMTFGAWTCAVSNAGAGGSVATACAAASGIGNVNTTVTMKVGAVMTLTVAATVAPGASGSLVNTATVTPPAGTNDPTPANNGASSTVVVTAAPAVVNVPALGPWTLALLALLLAAAAMRSLAPRRRPLRRQ